MIAKQSNSKQTFTLKANFQGSLIDNFTIIGSYTSNFQDVNYISGAIYLSMETGAYESAYLVTADLLQWTSQEGNLYDNAWLAKQAFFVAEPHQCGSGMM